jgi:hypothetical protein
MKQIIFYGSCIFFLFVSCAGHIKPGDPAFAEDGINYENAMHSKLKIVIGGRTFTATLYDNATVAAFKKLLPLTIEMVELNGNEKYADLAQRLPSDASNPGTIQAGDLMLYGSSTLVLFYKSFSTSYAYTRLGRIDDEAGLSEEVGSENVKVKFEMELRP